MRLDARLSRAVLIVLGVAVVAASLVSPALADHGRRYKGQGDNRGYGGPRVVQHVYSSPGRGYAYSRGSRGGPDLAVFIGGLIVGNALAHAAPPRHVYCPPVEADYYYDPYCHERFSSLDAYGDHLNGCSHATLVLVINGNTGRCIGERYWQGGRWRDRGDSRGYGDRDYNDRGYNDRGYGDDGEYGDQGDQGGNRNR